MVFERLAAFDVFLNGIHPGLNPGVTGLGRHFDFLDDPQFVPADRGSVQAKPESGFVLRAANLR